MNSSRLTLLCCAAALAAAGCVNTSFPVGPGSADRAATAPPGEPAPKAQAAAPTPLAPVAKPAAPRYLLQAGDQFDLKFFYTPELNESVVVRPDGKVSLQLVGELQAAGLSPGELERELHARYAKQLRDPAVTLVARQFGPLRVFVAGEVKNPGEVALQGPMTALQAIARAGFFTRDAEARSVVVLRYNGDDGPEFIVRDLKALVDGQPGTGGDVALQPMDVVFVPQTQIAGVADFFGRYVSNIVPLWRNLGFSMIYYTNRARVVGTVP